MVNFECTIKVHKIDFGGGVHLCTLTAYERCVDVVNFLNSLCVRSVVFGIAIAYFCNMSLSLEQYILEKWALAYQQKKALKNATICKEQEISK